MFQTTNQTWVSSFEGSNGIAVQPVHKTGGGMA